MENYTLSPDKIDKLFRFCEKHGIKYYDVQVELVDHLASAIETAMSDHPNLSFDDCLQKEYKGFGATGFAKLLSEKKKSIERNIRKKRIEVLKKSITPPMLFITLGVLFLPIYLIYHKEISIMKKLNMLCLILDVFVGIYWTTQITIFQRQRNKTRSGLERLKIMMEDIPQIWQASILVITIFNNLQGLIQFISYQNGNGNFYLISSYLVLNTMSSLLLTLFFKENAILHEYTKRNYPNAFSK
ncbi:hypothetical protein [Rhizosphaericola mali]|uniref:Uncharacterized protein n=1 Tax=Rhizosphaericola mali TaxID=2545455 RepID=A0A5P2G0S2_9BACT|nr:hypothetical protein [Rhizosphaericola mali]QES88248.1 hypothetical protein E0W69_006045 [Rhizosphaericola mali]